MKSARDSAGREFVAASVTGTSSRLFCNLRSRSLVASARWAAKRRAFAIAMRKPDEAFPKQGSRNGFL